MIRILLVLAALLLLAAPPAAAERWSPPSGGASLDLPEGEGWEGVDIPASALSSLPSGGVSVARRSLDGTRAAICISYPTAGLSEVSDPFITGFDKGLMSEAGTEKVSGERTAIAGHSAYRFIVRTPGGALMAGVVAINAGSAHVAQIVKAEGDPLLDPELAAFLDSYRLP